MDHARILVFRFFGLSKNLKIMIAKNLDLITDVDMELETIELCKLIFRRAEKKNKIEELRAMVETIR